MILRLTILLLLCTSVAFSQQNAFHLTWSEKTPNIAYYVVNEWSGKQTMTETSSITEIYMLPVARLGTNFFNVVAVGKNGVRSNPSTNISAVMKTK